MKCLKCVKPSLFGAIGAFDVWCKHNPRIHWAVGEVRTTLSLHYSRACITELCLRFSVPS